MEIQTLEELKKLNAGAESTSEDETAEVENDEVEAQEPEEAEESEAEAEETEADEDESEEAESNEPLEAWQASEDSEDSQDGKSGFVPNPAAKKLRLKAKALREERDEAQSELQQLKAEIEKLKSGAVIPAQSQPQQELKRPKLEDYDYDEERYNSALDDYYDKKLELKLSQTNQQGQQAKQLEALQQQRDLAVQKHYERAEELIKKHGISDEKYSNADGLIRSTIESALPNMGDSVADQLIAKLVESGEGSEKAWFYLGNNAGELAKLRKTLEDDPSGISTAIFMGDLRARATKPYQVKSKAPKPPKQIKGDSSVTASSLKKAYDKAKDSTERVAIRRKARKMGEDVSKWER